MRLVLTVIARNEGDILETTLRYHLAQGVDHILAIDDGSTDTTPEILDRFRTDGCLTLVARPSKNAHFGTDQPLWKTALSRLAATEHEADWVLPADADECWWPLIGDLKTSLALVPVGCDGVLAPLNDFIFTRTPARSAVEDLTTRDVAWTLGLKVAHRGFPDVVLDGGHHRAGRDGQLAGLDKWESGSPLRFAPITTLRAFHYGIRSLQQYEQTLSRRDVLLQMFPDGVDTPLGSPADRWRQDAVGRGLREGRLIEDRRLADFCASHLHGTAAGARGKSASGGAGGGSARLIVSEEMLEAQGLVMFTLQRRDGRLRGRTRRLRDAMDKWRTHARAGPLTRLRRAVRILGR